jgi:AmmeMemoRadiSam system protein A
MLTDAQRAALLRAAREAIIQHLGRSTSTPGLKEPRPPVSPDPRPPASGIFVTIKRHGELRGCLGVLEMRAPLVDEVVRCAKDSATADPRFPPMTLDEVADMTLEISVLGPLEQIDPLDDTAIVVGRHGLLVEDGHRRGLLLPQVATEWGWDREQFLAHTCRKARLPDDAWRTGARVFRFAADVFGEAQ